MTTVNKPSHLPAAIKAATPFGLSMIVAEKVFDALGQVRRNPFVRDLVQKNAQVLLNCNGSKKYYMRYHCDGDAETAVLFISVTDKGRLSAGSIR